MITPARSSIIENRFTHQLVVKSCSRVYFFPSVDAHDCESDGNDFDVPLSLNCSLPGLFRYTASIFL